VTLLHDAAHLDARRRAACESLAPLAESLAADLEPLLARELLIPTEKARLTRLGGRCPRDGTLLEFDPWSPREHRCPACGEWYRDEAHYRWWVMGYQLWLAERAVHAALLHALRGDPSHASLADTILEGYAELYLSYPNEDNVLGPTRPFFSTYLESIWLLQLCVALDLREDHGIAGPLADRVRDRVIVPSAGVIESYDEGDSNRQVWNNAALLAAARLLRDSSTAERVLYGESGLAAHLGRALLADGTWYEGENYHLFAHRGLWYGVTMADVAGAPLAPALVGRFREGFATPFLSALPDFTFPSRRDSQYAVSLRQWRFAELCELGLARSDDRRLVGALHELYAPDVPRGDTGRARSTAEAERNTPATRLTRADLGWRSLLHAPEALPPLEPSPPASALLAAQGLAVFRRDGGRVYAALDYGHSGGGHGHPDRLNVLLADGTRRVLDDVGTGSYVDPSLHWYRSTLAHNAPVVNGRSQLRRHGELLAYDERGGIGWVDATVAGVAPGVVLRRALVVMPDYVLDTLSWEGPEGTIVDLPVHVDGALHGVGGWLAGVPTGGSAPDDGFAHLTECEVAVSAPSEPVGLAVADRPGGREHAAWFVSADRVEWWRAEAPGAPGRPRTRFHFARQSVARGRLTGVWDWGGVVCDVRELDGRTRIELADGTWHEHARVDTGWQVTLYANGGQTTIVLTGAVARPAVPGGPLQLHSGPDDAPPHHPNAARIIRNAPTPLSFHLGASAYRRSELPWDQAGRPTADVALAAAGDELTVEVTVRKEAPLGFAPLRAENELDNEHPDTNSDGVQIHLALPPAGERGGAERVSTWLLVPDPLAPPAVRITAGAPDSLPLRAAWRQIPGGYAVRCAIALGPRRAASVPLRLDVIVNEMQPGRERRRGQLVLSGGRGEFVYLRGDRQAPERFLPFVVTDG